MLVNDFLEVSTEKFPDKNALKFRNQTLTYLDINELSNRFANALIHSGLQRQERVGIFLENSIESVIGIFATLKADGIFFVINPKVKKNKLNYILNDCQARMLLTDSLHLKELIPILSSCPFLKKVIVTNYEALDSNVIAESKDRLYSYGQLCQEFPASRPEQKNIDIDLASLIYTSGSTGQPKAVMLTHANMVSAADSIITYLENTPNDIIFNVLPLSFDYGLYQILMALKFGGTVILEQVFLYAYKIIEQIVKERATGFPIVPTIAAILFKLKNLSEYDFSHLRYITNTAQALPPQYISALQKIFPYTSIYSMYGLTECKRVSYLSPSELNARPTSVGKAMPNTETYIIDKKGRKITAAGKIGELVVRGANVMKGYWNHPKETDEVLKPGPVPGEKVLHTGDLFMMDSKEFLYFIARKDNMIKVGGERISPKEIEYALYLLEDVIEAAVVGVDDDILGQAIKAFIVLKKDSTVSEKDIIKHCSKTIEVFMVPKYVEIVRSLPKTTHGKIDKLKLQRGRE